jgi:hypothetical protein
MAWGSSGVAPGDVFVAGVGLLRGLRLLDVSRGSLEAPGGVALEVRPNQSRTAVSTKALFSWPFAAAVHFDQLRRQLKANQQLASRRPSHPTLFLRFGY